MLFSIINIHGLCILCVVIFEYKYEFHLMKHSKNLCMYSRDATYDREILRGFSDEILKMCSYNIIVVL